MLLITLINNTVLELQATTLISQRRKNMTSKFTKILAVIIAATITTSTSAISTNAFANQVNETDPYATMLIDELETDNTSETTTEEVEFNLPEKTEISFKVGDATLLINNESVTVEKPYVVGSGVTLVPVRVITEAFGAKVGWDGTTKTVTLDYPDVKIILQIGNPVAEVNGEAVTLLAPPELTPSGFTMVPLRFISENFGALVTYDPETQAITVTKENVSEGETIVGEITENYIGDSYYGWSMETPKILSMTYRSFNGDITLFENENSDGIGIYISKLDEDFNFEDNFKQARANIASEETLVKAEKDDSNESVKTMIFQSRDSYCFYEYRYFITDKYMYSTYVCVDNLEPIKSELLAITNTFAIKFDTQQTHDLSNVENGMREFSSEEMNFTIMLPADFDISENSKVNSFNFISSIDNSSLKIYIISKSEAKGTAEEYIKNLSSELSKGLNTKIAKATEVTNKKYNDIEGYEFDIIVNNTDKDSCVKKCVSFDLGEYRYAIDFTIYAPHENHKDLSQTIIENMVFNTIDAEKVGIILDAETDDTEEYQVAIGNHVIDMPGNFIDANPLYVDKYGRVVINCLYQSTIDGYTVSSFADALETQLSTASNTKIIESGKRTRNNLTLYRIIFCTEEDGQQAYTAVYVCEKDKITFIFTCAMINTYYSDYNLDLCENIISTLRNS